MAPSAPSDDPISTGRALAASGDWEGVRSHLATARYAGEWSSELSLLLAEAELRSGSPAAARELLETVHEVLQSSGDRPALRRAANLLGAACFEMGDIERAEREFTSALEMAREDGDALLVARATSNLGAISNMRGRHEDALAMYQMAIAAHHRIGNTRGLAECSHNMAITLRDLGQLDRADEHERKAIEYAREAADARLLAMARAGWAELYLLRGDSRRADSGAAWAAREYSALADPIGMADALRLLGVSRSELGDMEDALRALDQAVSLAREHGGALVEAEALQARAEIHSARGASSDARADTSAAREIFERLGVGGR